MLVFIDTHCHLNFESFEKDLSAVLERAKEVGVRKILNPAIDLESSQQVIDLSIRYGMIQAAVGVHPNSGVTWRSETKEQLSILAKRREVSAIGEIGLDYYREITPLDLQRQVFLEQLDLARQLSLPVVIHNREATDDILSILTDYKQHLDVHKPELAGRPGVLHSFSGNVEQAFRAVELNFYLGITGPVTFKKAEELRQVVREIPIEKLLIETDAPFLTPHPYRGRRNEPQYVSFVAAKLAEIKKRDLVDIAKITTNNAEHLFGWSVIV